MSHTKGYVLYEGKIIIVYCVSPNKSMYIPKINPVCKHVPPFGLLFSRPVEGMEEGNRLF